MNDTFAFRSVPVPLRRRVSHRAVKAAAVALALVFGLSCFVRWVSDSERASVAAAARHEAGGQIVGTLHGEAPPEATGNLVPASTEDRAAQATARRALLAARRIAAGPASFVEAGPAQLARRLPGLTFTDGPSPAPEIVSVAATGDAWAAAVQSSGGRCFSLRVDDAGHVRYGSSLIDCTGVAALRASAPSW